MTFYIEKELYAEQARAEGLAQGIRETTLSSINNLMANLHLTAEAAMAALGVAEADYPKYLAALK